MQDLPRKIGLYKTVVNQNRGFWRNNKEREFAALKRADWFNNGRLLEPIGKISLVEFEMAYYRL